MKIYQHYFNRIATHIKVLKIKDVALTNVKYKMIAGRAQKVTADPLTRQAGNTKGSSTSSSFQLQDWKEYLQPIIKAYKGQKERDYPLPWSQMHLLSHRLHGPGNQTWNLTPVPVPINTRGMAPKEQVIAEKIKKPGVAFRYETTLEYKHSNTKTYLFNGKNIKINDKHFPSNVKLEIKSIGTDNVTDVPNYEEGIPAMTTQIDTIVAGEKIQPIDKEKAAIALLEAKINLIDDKYEKTPDWGRLYMTLHLPRDAKNIGISDDKFIKSITALLAGYFYAMKIKNDSKFDISKIAKETRSLIKNKKPEEIKKYIYERISEHFTNEKGVKP